MKYLTFYTPNYAGEVDRLLSSAKEHGVHVEAVQIDSKTWAEATSYKATFMRDARLDYAGPICWIDADAEFHAKPTLLREIRDADIAVHYFKGVELVSSVVWVNNTDRAWTIMQRWFIRCQAEPLRWDQKCLQDVIEETPDCKVYELPPEYCCIFDLSRDYYGAIDPVIEQHQASRRLKS